MEPADLLHHHHRPGCPKINGRARKFPDERKGRRQRRRPTKKPASTESANRPENLRGRFMANRRESLRDERRKFGGGAAGKKYLRFHRYCPLAKNKPFPCQNSPCLRSISLSLSHSQSVSSHRQPVVQRCVAGGLLLNQRHEAQEANVTVRWARIVLGGSGY